MNLTVFLPDFRQNKLKKHSDSKGCDQKMKERLKNTFLLFSPSIIILLLLFSEQNAFRNEDQQLSYQRSLMCQEMGIKPLELKTKDCEFWLDTGLKKLKQFALTMNPTALSSLPNTEHTKKPLCHRKYETLMQQFLGYLLAPLKNDNNDWLPSWTDKEASQVVDRAMQIEKEHPWAQRRLGLMPGSMIMGKGKHQKIIRPKSNQRFVHFLLNQIGLNTEARQVRNTEGKRAWHYSLEQESLKRMSHYAEQRAQAHSDNVVGKILSRRKENTISPYIPGQVPESFNQWCKSHWDSRSAEKRSEFKAVEDFFCETSDVKVLPGEFSPNTTFKYGAT